MSFKKDVKKCLNSLQINYASGNINYPRVENDYIENENCYELVAHLPMSQSNKKGFKPIKKEFLNLSKPSGLLLLNQARLANPSNVLSMAETMDEYFDSEMNVVSEEKEKEITELFRLARKFLAQKFIEKEKITQERLYTNKEKSVYKDKDKKISFYKCNSLQFFTDALGSSGKKKRSPDEVRKSYASRLKKEEREKKEKELLRHYEYLAECLEDFREKENQKIEKIIKNNANFSKENVIMPKLVQKKELSFEIPDFSFRIK